jgi:rRNA maturation protein Nop10
MKNKKKPRKPVMITRQENMVRLIMGLAYGKKMRPCPTCNFHTLTDKQGYSRHARGCLNSHLYTTRKCKNCGGKFQPDHMAHVFCAKSCKKEHKKRKAK